MKVKLDAIRVDLPGWDYYSVFTSVHGEGYLCIYPGSKSIHLNLLDSGHRPVVFRPLYERLESGLYEYSLTIETNIAYGVWLQCREVDSD